MISPFFLLVFRRISIDSFPSPAFLNLSLLSSVFISFSWLVVWLFARLRDGSSCVRSFVAPQGWWVGPLCVLQNCSGVSSHYQATRRRSLSSVSEFVSVSQSRSLSLDLSHSHSFYLPLSLLLFSLSYLLRPLSWSYSLVVLSSFSLLLPIYAPI